MNEFEKFAVKGQGIGSATLSRYASALDAYINPTITEERKLNVAQMDVFSRLMMDRIIFLGVPIDDDVANIVMAQLLFLSANDSAADITMYLNTPGGQVSSGLAIYDTMQIIQPDVHSRVLIHQPLGGAQGQASDILIAAREIEKTRTELFRIIAEHSGQKIERVAADGDRDFWMTAEEAREYGMVDEVLYKKGR